jgi:hypothetical protein
MVCSRHTDLRCRHGQLGRCQGMDFCTSCGRPRTGADRFCTTCGTEFRDLVPPGQPAAAADPASAEDYYAPGSVGPGPPISQWAPYARPPETEPSYPGEVYSGIAHDERFGGEPVYRGEPAFGGPGYTGGDSYPEPARRPPGRRNVPIVIAAAVIVLGAAGGAYAVTASHSHGKAAGQPTETASIAASQGAPTSAVQTSAAPATSAPAPPTASSGTTVSVASGAANNPAATQVTATTRPSPACSTSRHDSRIPSRHLTRATRQPPIRRRRSPASPTQAQAASPPRSRSRASKVPLTARTTARAINGRSLFSWSRTAPDT